MTDRRAYHIFHGPTRLAYLIRRFIEKHLNATYTATGKPLTRDRVQVVRDFLSQIPVDTIVDPTRDRAYKQYLSEKSDAMSQYSQPKSSAKRPKLKFQPLSQGSTESSQPAKRFKPLTAVRRSYLHEIPFV
jgi:hypothetical protein